MYQNMGGTDGMQFNMGPTSCKALPRAAFGLTVGCLSLVIMGLVVFKCRADIGAMSRLKLQTMVFAA
jgi:hypothetical protein